MKTKQNKIIKLNIFLRKPIYIYHVPFATLFESSGFYFILVRRRDSKTIALDLSSLIGGFARILLQTLNYFVSYGIDIYLISFRDYFEMISEFSKQRLWAFIYVCCGHTRDNHNSLSPPRIFPNWNQKPHLLCNRKYFI